MTTTLDREEIVLNSSQRRALIERQKELCEDRNLPMFAPSDGRCSNCHQYIVDDSWSLNHITGCKHCNRSFTD